MKVRSSNGGNVMFHSECFMCYVCGCPLPPGAHFGLLPDCGHGEIVLCERDFEERGPLIQQQQQQQQQRMVRPGMMLSHDSPMLENHHPFAGAPPGHFGIPGPDGSIVMLESTPLMSVDEHRSQHQAVPQQQQQHHHHQPSTKQEAAAAAHNKGLFSCVELSPVIFMVHQPPPPLCFFLSISLSFILSFVRSSSPLPSISAGKCCPLLLGGDATRDTQCSGDKDGQVATTTLPCV